MREADLLKYIYQSQGPKIADKVILGPGDDMAVVRLGGENLLVAVDQVIDSLHFDLQTTRLERIGRKALTRNLSDIAAMAAVPVGAVVAVCLPEDFGEKKAQQLFDCISKTGQEFNCPVMGGDISIWGGKLVCSVTVFAKPDGIEPVLRKGAQIGDCVYVTGQLGGSLEQVGGYLHHSDFAPLMTTARTLAGNAKTRPHCMIDISDGLVKDLERLCVAGNVGAAIEIDKLPISQAAEKLSRRTQKPAWQHAIGDGEDYQLLFTAPFGAIPENIKGVRVTAIGKITGFDKTSKQRASFVFPDGRKADTTDLGWEHKSN